MKSWKLVFFALFGAFSLASSACVITSDDDDDFGDDDDFDDDFGGFGGTGGFGGASGFGGTAGAGGNGGTGGLTGGTVVDDLVNLFAEPVAADACRSCAQNNCAAQNAGCGATNANCAVSMACIYDDLTAQAQAGNATLSIDCAFASCSSEFVGEPAMNEFASCISMYCIEECGVDVEQDPVCD